MIDLFPFGKKSSQIIFDDPQLMPDYYSTSAADGQLITDWHKAVEADATLTRKHIQTHHNDTTDIQYIFQVDRKIAGIINSETSTMTVSLKNYTFDSFRNICSDEGMIIEGVYGSYLGKPYEALDPRMIFLLR